MYITNLEEVVPQLRDNLRNYLVAKLGIRANARKFKCFIHDDNDPSMYFNPKTNDQTVKCFACGWSGDIFAAAAAIENLPASGPEWLSVTIPSLCNTLNIPIKIGEPSSADKEKAKLQKLLQDTADILYDKGQELDYVKERKWSQEELPAYSINEDELVSLLVENGWDSAEILNSGAIKTRYLSLFGEDKITFTIRNHIGSPIGFVSRPIAGEARAKYVNSPESSLYVKSQALLGIDVAKKKGDAAKKGLYIVEGPGDLAQLYRVGIYNAVAVCGTAFTEHHLLTLKTLGIRKLYFSFDWDNPGHLATQRVLENVLGATSGVTSYVVMPPSESPNVDCEGNPKDPDEFLKTFENNEPEYYLALAKVTAFEWQLSQASENESPDTICQRMISTIASEEAAIKRELLVKTLSDFTGISTQAIATDVNALRDDKFRQRREKLIAASELYVQSVQDDPENIMAHISNHETKIHNIEKEFRKHSVGINYQISRYEAMQERRSNCTEDQNMSTFQMNYFNQFESAMAGGMNWTSGCLMYVGGRANSGKTATVLAIGCDVALSDPNATVLIHSTDDSYEQIEPRLKSNLFSMINQSNLKLSIGMIVQPHVYLSPQSAVYHTMYDQAIEVMKDLLATERLVVIDSEDGNTLSVLEKNIRYYRQRYPGRKLLVVCDNTHNYMDFINMDQTTRMTYISNQQKTLTVKYNCCMIATAEYRKNMPMDQSKMRLPVDDDLADARSLMYRPNIIFHVYNDLHDRKEHAEIFWKNEEGKAQPRLLLHFTKNKISGFKEKLIVDLDPDTVALKPKGAKEALIEAESYRDMKEKGITKLQGTQVIQIEATEYEREYE